MKMDTIFSGVTAIATVFGLGVAYYAFNYYAEQQWDSNYDRLEERDVELADRVFENPKLHLIYVPTEASGLNGSEIISKYLSTRSNFVRADPQGFRFTNAREMSCSFWSEAFDETAREELMPFYFFAEAHLLTLADAWRSFDSGSDKDEEVRDNFSSYVKEIGTDVFFVTAVFELARYGYYPEDFFVWLRLKLLDSSERIAFYESVFPEILALDDWRALASDGRETGGSLACEG